jgi:hypothetical protein
VERRGYLEVDDKKNVGGNIQWSGRGPRGGKYNGVETVKGTLKRGNLNFKGTKKTGNIVLCDYKGTCKGGQLNLEWKPLVPSPNIGGGNAKGPARLVLTTHLG